MASAIVLLTVILAICSLGLPKPRQKRRVDQMGDMIRMTTGRNPFHFNGYGHWCGPLNDGVERVYDEIDRCCMGHDRCYGGLIRGGSCTESGLFSWYYRVYEWHVEGSEIICTTHEPCLHDVCECDRVIAECLGVHHHMYNASYQSVWGRIAARFVDSIG